MADESRPHDLILFGATGFAGGLTAEYLARHAPADCRWALAGRDTGRLADVRDRLTAIRPEWGDLPLLPADAADPAALRGLAEQTRVVATTVGPYLRYGEPLAAACAAAGTDYADLAGEAEFVDRVYVRHHERARETGARLVHSCGFDCTPFDLGVRYTVEQLPEDVPLRVDGFLRAAGRISGGTLASALGVVSRQVPAARAARARRKAEPPVPGRRVRAPLGAPTRSGALRTWGLPMPTLESQVVARSAAALPRYGPDFRYRHYAAVKRLPVAAGLVLGAGAFGAAAQLPPLRKLMTSRLAPGTGPSEERRARSWFSARFVGTAGDRRVLTEVSGGDPAYDETAKILAEAAMCLAYDPLPETSGQVTTAQAMGEALTERLVAAGMGFRVRGTSP